MAAAADCRNLAVDIMKLRDSVDKVEQAVYQAWKGNGSNSLADQLVNDASQVSYSAGVIRDAVVELQNGARALAKAQAEATRKAWSMP